MIKIPLSLHFLMDFHKRKRMVYGVTVEFYAMIHLLKAWHDSKCIAAGFCV